MCAKKTTEKRKRTTKKEKDPDAPKRPLSSYMLFCQEERENVKEEHPDFKAKDILSELGRRWKALDDDEKKAYTDKFNANKKVYEVEKKAYDAKKKSEASDDEDESEDEKPKKKAKAAPKKAAPKKKAPPKKQESEDEEEDEDDDDESDN